MVHSAAGVEALVQHTGLLPFFRRNGYSFDARYDDGLACRKCKLIVDALEKLIGQVTLIKFRLSSWGLAVDKPALVW